ncbi:hypothetical protein [Terribacillus halophilus]|uniref:hypothetical protein n=1 Tax=Terribacillus halophilus TaxID=361279 RepID=UPI0009879D28|nr:hypothetical protein [Terribacillus halophilus]
MRGYLWIVSVAMLILTITLFQLAVVYKLPGIIGMLFLMFGASLAILSAIFSEGRPRIILLSFYGAILSIFIVFTLGFGIAHM